MAQKKRTFKEIKSSIPAIEKADGVEKVEVLSDELDRILAIKRVFESEGGKELITVLRNNCYNSIKKALSIAKDNPDLTKLLSALFEYSANLDLLATVQDIGIEDELRAQLDEAVKEAMNVR